jgi:hypothetical protein
VKYPVLALWFLGAFRSEMREKFEAHAPDG